MKFPMRLAAITGISATALLPMSVGSTAQAATRYYYLQDRPVAEGWNPIEGLININGRAYPRSISQGWLSPGDIAATQYNVNRRCNRLGYTSGVTDNSNSTSVARFEVYGDNRRLKVVQLGFGHAAYQTVNISRVLRLKVVTIGIKGTNYGLVGGWGDASVRCTAAL